MKEMCRGEEKGEKFDSITSSMKLFFCFPSVFLFVKKKKGIRTEKIGTCCSLMKTYSVFCRQDEILEDLNKGSHERLLFTNRK